MNPGCELDFRFLNDASINSYWVYEKENEIIKQADKFVGSYRAAWLLRAVSCLDLTTLSGNDTWSNVSRMCIEAANPISSDILNALDFKIRPFTTAAVCIYPTRIADARNALGKRHHSSFLPVAAVSAGFPSGQFSLSSRLQTINECILDGADEIDVVIDRSLVMKGEWEQLYDEIKEMKKISKTAKLKTILSVGELGNLRNVYKASLVAMMAGSDFIKTSTGMEKVNATFPVGLVMLKAIKEYYLRTSYKVGFKAAGGIKTANDALSWMYLVKSQLGPEWLNNTLFRIGASQLLKAIEKELLSTEELMELHRVPQQDVDDKEDRVPSSEIREMLKPWGNFASCTGEASP